MNEAGVSDDNLAILYKAIKTPVGPTVREKIKKIILQGDVFGPLSAVCRLIHSVKNVWKRINICILIRTQ